jgi:putative membrane protein
MPDLTEPNDDARTRLAAERTLLAWVRTSIALMGLGFVVARFGLFLHELAAVESNVNTQRSGWSLWIGMLLIVLGVAISLGAAWEHMRFLRHLRERVPYLPPRLPLTILVAVILAIVGAGMTVYLLLLGLGGT